MVPSYSNLNVSEATDEFYRDLMVSGTIPQDLQLKNCTLEDELERAAQGTGLAFIVMADVFTKLPGAPFWSLLFFAMLLTLGLGSQIGILEGLLGTVFDIPQFKHISKPVLSGKSSQRNHAYFSLSCTKCSISLLSNKLKRMIGSTP